MALWQLGYGYGQLPFSFSYARNIHVYDLTKVNIIISEVCTGPFARQGTAQPRAYYEGDDGGKLSPISARGGEFLHLGGDSKHFCLANITGFSWNNNLIRLLLSQFYVI